MNLSSAATPVTVGSCIDLFAAYTDGVFTIDVIPQVAEWARAFGAYPNPTQETATISYRVPAGQQPVSLAVCNTMGQLVRSLAQGKQAGSQENTLRNLPSVPASSG